MDYPSIATGLDLNTKVVWTQNVDGSAYQGLGRDEKRLTVGGDFKYLGNFQVGMTYVAYLSCRTSPRAACWPTATTCRSTPSTPSDDHGCVAIRCRSRSLLA